MTTDKMSKTAALREARLRISLSRMGRGWTVYMPYRWDEPRGPSTGGRETSWPQARAHHAYMVAWTALRLMGVSGEFAGEAIGYAQWRGYTTIPEIVDYVLRGQSEQSD